MATTLVKKVRGPTKYKGLMKDGRAWVKISPALIPWVKRHLRENPSGLNALVCLALAEHFDAQAAREKADAAARAGVGDG